MNIFNQAFLKCKSVLSKANAWSTCWDFVFLTLRLWNYFLNVPMYSCYSGMETFFFWSCCVACEILVLWQGIELMLPSGEMWSLNQWTTKEVPRLFLKTVLFIFILGKPQTNSFYYLCVCSAVQLWPILCDSMDCSRPASSIHGIFQTILLEWVYYLWKAAKIFKQ